MPAFEKSPPELIARFDAVAARFAGGAARARCSAIRRSSSAATSTTGLFADRWMIRLPDDDRAELLALPGASAVRARWPGGT